VQRTKRIPNKKEGKKRGGGGGKRSCLSGFFDCVARYLGSVFNSESLVGPTLVMGRPDGDFWVLFSRTIKAVSPFQGGECNKDETGGDRI